MTTEDHSIYPTDVHDSPNRGGEIEETHMSESHTEDQQPEEIGGVPITAEIIGGAATEKSNDDNRKDNKDTNVKEIKIAKPKVQFVRESYMLRERKPARTLLAILANDNREHSYNLSIKTAIKTHGDIAVKELYTECSSLLRKSTFHPVSRRTLTEVEIKSVIRSSCFMKEKATPAGVVDKVKARVVFEGNQDTSIYTLDETSSPTVSTAAVLVTMAIAAHDGEHFMTIDVETAYLNAKMIDEKPVYMKIGPLVTAILTQLEAKFEKYQDSKGAVIVKLDASSR